MEQTEIWTAGFTHLKSQNSWSSSYGLPSSNKRSCSCHKNKYLDLENKMAKKSVNSRNLKKNIIYFWFWSPYDQVKWCPRENRNYKLDTYSYLPSYLGDLPGTMTISFSDPNPLVFLGDPDPWFSITPKQIFLHTFFTLMWLNFFIETYTMSWKSVIFYNPESTE